ncbi:GNAT family N-acetyltransferase [Maribacter confluentis]|uniref:GNAT family N-acetyltransferase n=1 Tax=Maribacter confluentis TaxID=1656093 RepID=A0ABT8RYU2_9FLAO|nr:GNAT family N-acetyltransferase [Maribacter confluentis]MDO1513672.1 GNAT family N-acetyltransferase [Maribacter confluentis]MDO1514801.1 GNAT family N-acetyltransferase [Maribacter confluentis]
MLSTLVCANDDEWNDFLEKENNHQMVTIAHNPCLGKILSNTFGYSSTNYFIKDREQTIGVMPIVNVGKKMVSMPHFSYGGPLVQTSYANNVNISSLINAPSFEIRSFEKLSEHYIDKKISCILKLQDTEDEMFMTIKAKLRQKIRKTLKINFDVKSGGIELLNDFYTIFSQRMLKFGSPPLGKQFFRNLLQQYTYGDVQITVIYDGVKAISAGFSLSYLGFNELCWSGTDETYNKQNVNALMFWEMIKTSIAKEHRYFSFGRSTIDSSQHEFKKLWNPMELPIYYNLSEEPKTSLRDFEFLTKIWKYQPLRTSQILGHYVSKYVY